MQKMIVFDQQAATMAACPENLHTNNDKFYKKHGQTRPYVYSPLIHNNTPNLMELYKWQHSILH